MSSPHSSPDIILYTGQTPNGVKISITLEELSLPYTVYKVDVPSHEQKSEWYTTKINPNGRIPAITDTLNGETIRVFESGSIMQYLVDRYDTENKISYPRGSKEWIEMNSWLFWLNAGLGPMQGQANHFYRYTTVPSDYSTERYQTETRRLYSVLDTHLKNSNTPYIVGEKCTIADIATWPWVTLARWSLGGEASLLDQWPHLKEWEERMVRREGVEKGRQVPDKHQREMLRDDEAMKAFEERGRAFYRKLAEEEKEKK